MSLRNNLAAHTLVCQLRIMGVRESNHGGEVVTTAAPPSQILSAILDKSIIMG